MNGCLVFPLNRLESTWYGGNRKKFFGVIMRVERMGKVEKIKQTREQTKERRKNRIPVVYQLKIHLNSTLEGTKEKLFKLFLEAKWLYNYTVAENGCSIS